VRTLESESHLATGIVRDDNDGVVIVVSGDGIGVMMVDLLICYLSDRHSIISPGNPSHQYNHARCVIKRVIIESHEIQHANCLYASLACKVRRRLEGGNLTLFICKTIKSYR